jgi:hypothetical protein
MTTIAGHVFDFSANDVERTARDLEPEPIDVHFAVVAGRRFPPKQLVEALTGLDRGDFNSHQARALLVRLGFAVERRHTPTPGSTRHPGPSAGAGTNPLDPYVGRWVAQDGVEILFDAATPQEVAKWLHRHRRHAAVWRIPSDPREVGSATSSPR